MASSLAARACILLLLTRALGACDLCAVSSVSEEKDPPESDPLALPAFPLKERRGGSQAGVAAPNADGEAPARNGAGDEHPPEPTATPAVARPAHRRFGGNVGLIQTYASSATARSGRREIDDPAGQFLHASSTQAFIGARAGRFGLRAYLPYDYREYRRAIPSGVQTGWLYGPGDTTVEATALAYKRVSERRMTLVTAILGVKLPTGDSSLLDQEEDPAQGQGLGGGHVHGTSTGGTPSLVHPHDLALGTGSYDGVIGVSTYLRAGGLYLSGRLIYDARTEGTGGYRCADQWSWGGGPGLYLLARSDRTVGLLANVSGEHRGYDEHRGHQVDDSGITEVFIGPELTGTLHGLSGEVGLDLPLLQRAHGQQLTADYRGHAGINWGF